MLEVGQTIAGQYRIQRVLGRGSFSTVYLADDIHFPGGRRVAIKEFNPDAFRAEDREWARDTIAQEARLRGNLPSHSGLANVLGYFEAGNRSYLVLEYVEGQTLEQVWRQQPGHRFDEAQVMSWAAQLCDVLAFLHGQSPPIIYRDLKPANIMVQPDGSLKLIDFGIARLHQPQQSSDTINLGTPGYAAPEQYQNEQSDERSDIYALGVILHQLLTGIHPQQHALNLPSPRSVNENLSPRVAAVIEQATAIAPAHRFRSIDAFRNALQGASGESGPLKTTVSPTRRRLPVILSSVFILVVVGGTLFFLWFENVRGENNNSSTPETSPPAVAKAKEDDDLSQEQGNPNIAATQTAALEATSNTEQLIAEAVSSTGTAAAGSAALEVVTAEAATRTSIAMEASATTTPTVTPSPSATPEQLPETWIGKDGKMMRLVPAGEFLMGSTASGVDLAMRLCNQAGEGGCGFAQFSNEMPQRAIYLDAFYIDVTEVNNTEYAACVQARACNAPVPDGEDYNPGDYFHNSAYSEYPVIRISWHDARAYCQWLGESLPTEAQWEKAARGIDGRLFPWGDQWDCTRANTEECGGNRLHPIGSFPDGASPYGVLDMAGNVWEWIEDAFNPDYYNIAPGRNPPPAEGGNERVLRGGGYSSFQHYVRTTNRGFATPGTASSYRGFRCVIPAEQIVR